MILWKKFLNLEIEEDKTWLKCKLCWLQSNLLHDISAFNSKTDVNVSNMYDTNDSKNINECTITYAISVYMHI